ncbi:MAG TPA: septum formation initiator family protein [Candidatus Limiplasma sp.]|nr:septum formation initiator family protein [Candidatus Limiplasma sp.]HPS81626.1 septum formation initiator family protein [Candidatus Limiplasma sp.]
MRKRVGLYPVLAILGCLAIAFLWVYTKLDQHISDVNLQYQQAISANSSLETEQTELKNTLASANTDAFIESQARTLYDYMKPDEIRFVITNPEALYGTDGQ